MHTLGQIESKKIGLIKARARLMWTTKNRPDQKDLIRHQRSVMINLQTQLLREGVRI